MEFTLKRGDKEFSVEGKTFDGVDYHVTFRPNKNIDLTRVRFLGPHFKLQVSEEEDLDYKIHFEILSSRRVGVSKTIKTKQVAIFPRTTFTVTGRKNEMLEVEFHTPVPVKKGQWIDVVFQIEGLATECLCADDVYTDELKEVDSNTEFQFLLGCSQLAEIDFVIQ